jgi:hypothetical protein
MTKKTLSSRVLVLASVVFLGATVFMVIDYGQLAYFKAFHKPFHIALLSHNAKYEAPVLPVFKVKSSISSESPTPNSRQTITVSASSNKNVSGYVEVWIESPKNKDVYMNPTPNAPIQFVSGKNQTFTYSYSLPSNLPPGTYKVSEIITSKDTNTDYYVNTNFAEFTLS